MEYIVALVLIACVLIGVYQLFGDAVGSQFDDGSDTIGSVGEEREADAETLASIDGSMSSAKNQRAVELNNQNGPEEAKGGRKGGRIKKKPAFEDRTQHPRMRPGLKEEAPSAGFNPLVIFIFIFLGLVLCFVIFKGNKGE